MGSDISNISYIHGVGSPGEMSFKWAVIGCGNPNRQDDGVGSYVIDLLKKKKLGSQVRLFDAGVNGIEVVYQAKGINSLIVVDAKSPEECPGAIYEVPGDVLEDGSDYRYNSHSFRWDNALYVGKRIYKDSFPQTVKVFLIEAEKLGYGVGLTDKVEEAANKVAGIIEEIISPPMKKGVFDTILLESGKIHLNKNLVKNYFSQVDSVVVVIRDGYLQILPVHSGVGGYLLKVRNAAGDRVIAAHDVLFSQGWDDSCKELRVHWSDEKQGLLADISEMVQPVS